MLPVRLSMVFCSLVFVLLRAGVAFATPSAFEVGGAPSTVVQRKPLFVISPTILEQVAPDSNVGEETRFSVDILIGLESAVRLGVQITEVFDGTFLVLEGLVGGAVGVAGITPIAGGGLRVHFNLAQSSNGRNALFVSPALDVLVAWVYEFSQRLGITLGLSAGAQVSMGGLNNRGEETRGEWAPRVSVFSGFRF